MPSTLLGIVRTGLSITSFEKMISRLKADAIPPGLNDHDHC